MTKERCVIGHFDVVGGDLIALKNFYGNLFDWDIESQGPGYAQIDTPGLRGALVEAPHAAMTIGVIVPDLNKALAHAEELGGTIVMPATDNGWVCKGEVRDPAGNLVTLIQK
jgi:predicted enzyme related to lactoylglutathione lyase